MFPYEAQRSKSAAGVAGRLYLIVSGYASKCFNTTLAITSHISCLF